MAKKSRTKKSKKSTSLTATQLDNILPIEADAADRMAFQLLCNYVNGTDRTDIRTMVSNSYAAADEFLKTMNERHSQ